MSFAFGLTSIRYVILSPKFGEELVSWAPFTTFDLFEGFHHLGTDLQKLGITLVQLIVRIRNPFIFQDELFHIASSEIPSAAALSRAMRSTSGEMVMVILRIRPRSHHRRHHKRRPIIPRHHRIRLIITEKPPIRHIHP